MEDRVLEIFGIRINVENIEDEKHFKEIITLISNFEAYCLKNMKKSDRISSFAIIGENTSLNFSYCDGILDTYVEVKGADFDAIVKNFDINLFLKIYSNKNLETCFNRMKNYKRLENVKLYTSEYINGVSEIDGGHDGR